jgi:hypothetical protein
MKWQTIESLWMESGMKVGLRVRFIDWNHQVQFFMITGESSDGKNILGKLDNGEAMSFSKSSAGWTLYTYDNRERARAV